VTCNHSLYGKIFMPNVEAARLATPIPMEGELVDTAQFRIALSLLSFYKCICFSCGYEWEERA